LGTLGEKERVVNKLDRKIEERLAVDESPLLGPLDEPPLLQQAAEAFRGRFGWMMAIASVATVAGVVFAVVSAIYFFRAQTVQEMIAWASGFGLGLIIAATSRLWGWMTLSCGGSTPLSMARVVAWSGVRATTRLHTTPQRGF
jgi:protein-S-isoprenylcysteine O-methyltransferase Ste14